MLRLAFITDQHISVEAANPLGIDTKARFLHVLKEVEKRGYKGVILGGDLCFMNGDEPTYEWYRGILQSLPMPYYIIPGNHDNPVLMAQVFPEFPVDSNSEMYYKKSWGDIHMFFLDTTKGYMMENQYQWLSDELTNYTGDKVWICMHHPPVLTGSKHMDSKYAFKEIDKFAALCKKFMPMQFFVFSGHCHLERTIISAPNLQVSITPSTYVNIDPDFEDFTPLSLQSYGFRELIWPAPDTFLTNVWYPVSFSE